MKAELQHQKLVQGFCETKQSDTKTPGCSCFSPVLQNSFLCTKSRRMVTPHMILYFVLFSFLLGYSTVAFSQATPVVSVRFANPHYECLTGKYCVDVEFLSNTAGVQVFTMNVRFFYPDDILELVLPPNGPAFSDFQGGYGPISPDPPTVLNSPPAGPALFNFVGSADFVNGAIQLVNPMAPPIPLNTVTWTKLFQVCFFIDAPNPDMANFCPSLVWDLEVNPANGGFLLGDDGVVITLVDPTMMMESVPSDEMVQQFNWAYSGPGTPPYGMPVANNCISIDCSPMLMCAADVTIECDESTAPANTGFATATDICDGDITISFGDMVNTGNCPNNFTITRTWTAVNICDLTDMCVQLITVNDVTAPSILCPGNVTVQCASLVPPNNPASVGATDNCGGTVTTSFVGDVISNQVCTNRYTVTRTYRATDACGNSSSCDQTINVFDNTPPGINCPANLTVQCANQVPTPVVGSVGSTDNCGGGSTVTHVGDVISGQTCANRYTVTRTYRATDACGNSATCNQLISVFDNTTPGINCPSNITVQCASQVPAPDATLVGSTDNCGGTATVTHVGDALSGQTCANRYTVTRTYRATDACGNSATCNQIILVFDNTAPSITCPANLTIQCTDSTAPGEMNGMASGSDNCGGGSIPSEVWINEFHYDNTGVDAGEFIEVAGPSGIDLSLYSFVLYNGTGGAVYTTTVLSGIIPNQSNGFGTVFFSYPVNGIQNGAPDGIALVKGAVVIQFLSYEGVFIGVGGPANGLMSTGISVLENGSEALGLSLSLIGSGNMYSNFTWSGPSAQSPGAINPGQTMQAAGGGGMGPMITFNDVTIAGACPQEYTITRTWRATDACGNSSTCNQTLFVDDSAPPSISCPTNLTVQCASQVPAANPGSITSTDNCSGTGTVIFLGDVISNQTCTNRFTVTRTYRASDACGNSATCNQTITVSDNTAPTLNCPSNLTVQCASQVPASNTNSVTASDNCGGGATVSFIGDVISNQTCTNRFTLTRTYRATDVCGNSATCSQLITVLDNTVPSITCPVNVTVQCASQVPGANPASVMTSDNCGGATTVVSVGDVISNQTCANRFIVTRTYRSTDACGNSATCAQLITVNDNTAPTISCPSNLTVQCASQVPAVNAAGVMSTDNCGGTATVTIVSDVISNQTCVNRFIVTRTFRATDACGNSATCTQIVTVFDNTAPVINITDPRLTGVPNGGTATVQCFGQDPEWDFPEFDAGGASASDNCTGNVTITFGQVIEDEGDCEIDGFIIKYRLTWTATDACGNSSSKFVFLILVDDIPPVIHGVPDDITVSCDQIPDPPFEIYATDECLCACIILFNETSPAPGCQDGQVITRSWRARDDCGNETTEVQKITLTDDQNPVLLIQQPELAGIPDGTVLDYTCNEGGIPDFYDDLSGESMYSPPTCGNTIINFEKDILVANYCKARGYIEKRTFHWRGVDPCGNETNLTIVARLIDTEEPVLFNVPEITCVDDPALKEIYATDNCGDPHVRYFDRTILSPCGPGNAISRTYEAYDNCGNFTRNEAILILNDHSHPNLSFVNPVLADLEFGEILVVECGSYNGNYTPYGPEDVVAANSCSEGITVHFHERVIDAGNCENGTVATLALEWSATDICGNLTIESIIARVVDTTKPIFLNLKPEVTIGCNDELPEIKATDNCGEVLVTIEENIIPGSCEYEYDIRRTLIAADPCGNTTTKFQTIHVGDGEGPVIKGVIAEVCDDVSIPVVTAYDPCADKFVEVSMTEDTLDIVCRDGFVIERVWSAVDACGNITTVVQHIVVDDKTPPVIQIPTYSIIRKYLDAVGKNTVYLSQAGIIDKLNALDEYSVFVEDDCGQQLIPLFSLEIIPAGNCVADGYFEQRVYTWVAIDVCGNSSSISFSIYIRDDLSPVLHNVPIDELIICQSLPSPPVIWADDDAQPVTIVYSEQIEPGDGPGVFDVTRKWVATDACGNVSVVVQHIIWIPDTFLSCDIILPDMVECNSHGVVISGDVSGGFGDITYFWEIIGEKCFIQGGQGTPEIMIYVGWTQVQIILTVTDAYGCSSTCTATLDCVIPGGNPVTMPLSTTNALTTGGSGIEMGSRIDSPVPSKYLSQLRLWPNPANESVIMSFDSYTDNEIQFTLIDLLGRPVLSKILDAHKGSNKHNIDISEIPDGSYMIKLKTDAEMHSKVVVIFHND